MKEMILPYFKIPQLEHYNGTSDPLDHLDSYNTYMMIQDASDALHCLAFSTILKKVAMCGTQA